MRYVAVILVLILAGCANTPPKPPLAKGEYRPVNKPMETRIQANAIPAINGVFNFKFDGDIADALVALRTVQPQLSVMPPVGVAIPVFVRINLTNTTLEAALRAIGEQGAGVAEVVWSSTKSQRINHAFVRFRSASKSMSDKDNAVAVKSAQRTDGKN